MIWSTIPQEQVDNFLGSINEKYREAFVVTYKQKSAARFEEELVSALAAGSGPDLVIVPSDMMVSAADKLYPMPVDSLSERQFKDTYVDGTAMFWTPEGALALPLYVDPLVMYWNKDTYAAAGVSVEPKTWNQVPMLAGLFTKRDDRGNISESAFAMGSARNVAHAKEILSALFLQAGSPIVQKDPRIGYVSAIGDDGASGQNVDQALRFYTDIESPTSASYSWNSALPLSTDAFTAGTLATYFGSASEYAALRERNPHLNFDVAGIPQIAGVSAKRTFGRMYALATVKTSKNLATALSVALVLSSAENSSQIASLVGLPSLRRDVLAAATTDPALDVFNKSALISVAWRDPREKDTRQIFSDMIDSVIIGRLSETEAISSADSQIQQLFPVGAK